MENTVLDRDALIEEALKNILEYLDKKQYFKARDVLLEFNAADIADIMEKATLSPDIAVVITGKHSCMTARGIKNVPAVTVTTTFRGAFREDENLKDRVLRLIELKQDDNR